MSEVLNESGERQRDTLPPLAIVGIGSLFPKAASREEFWRLVKNGIDAITEVPETHWRPEDYYAADQKKPDYTYGRRGGFLDAYPFDPLKYGVPPNAIEATDTSQLLGMVVADEAMRDAGYGSERAFDRDRVSVILGVTGALELVIPLGARLGHPTWREAMLEAGLTEAQADDIVQRIGDRYVAWQENSFPGLLGNVVAGRISKFLNTGGTNCVVDAACASSLSALELAALELATGKSDMVLTGGADTFNDIFMYMCFSKTPALSPTGDARPFAQGSDGTILGEGLGIVVLKRLADAERDGDKIYAVIRGIGSSSDGKGDAIYAPSAAGQAKALRDAYANAGVSPDSIDLLEAHGTGTARGDAVETSALRDVYGDLNGRAPWCALGSIKSQIGHTKAAAGAAGLIKAALALHNKVLPPTIKVEQPADTVAPDQSPFYVNTGKRPWLPRAGQPRRAAVSSFGFGGSNFHLVLEEYCPEKSAIDWDGAVQIFAYSGATPKEIESELDAIPPDASWEQLRDTAMRSRNEFDGTATCRLVFVVERNLTNAAELIAKAKKQLAAAGDRSWTLPEGIYYGAGKAEGTVAMVFPGQGAQYPGMLCDLACQFPQMLETLSVVDAEYDEDDRGERLSDRIYPRPAFDRDTKSNQEAALRATEVAQPALGAVSFGAYRVLEHFGVGANAFAGHSYGELVALAAAGTFDVSGLARASKARGELMGRGDGDRGNMLAVRAGEDTIRKVLGEEALDLVLANKNTPEQIVLSGDTNAIERAAQAFSARKISATKLNVAAAFHSAFVSDAAGPFAEALDGVEFRAPKTPVYANTTAAPYPEDVAEARDQLAHQLARPVNFVGAIEAMYADGVRTFVEAGPGARLTGMIQKILHDRPHQALALDSSNGKRDGIADLARVLAALAAGGRGVALAKWDEGHRVEEKDAGGKPRMVVPICGANYRSETTKAKSRPPIMETQSEPTTSSTSNETIRGSELPNERKPPVASPPTPPPAVSETRAPGPTPSAAVDGPLGELFRQSQASLTALQQMQEQTARLHAQYLQGQEAATETFHQLLAQQQQLFARLTGGPAPAPSRPMPEARSAAPVGTPASGAQSPAVREPEPDRDGGGAAVAPVAPAESTRPDLTPMLLDVVSEKTGYPEEMLELDMALDADLGIDSIKRVEILSALQERVPGLPSLEAEELGSIHTLRDIVAKLDSVQATERGAKPTAAMGSSAKLERLLLGVVSEKTGYPEEMLELDLALDADLGIDSIKRVEILSALQERMPTLPSLEAEELASIHTLRDVVTKLHAMPADGTASGVGAAPITGAPSQDAGAGIESLLLEVVAEKTGYPEEMLELDMALDADLGIDSIKRVEILSALQERMPALPSLEAEAVGALVTLRDVAEAMGSVVGHGREPAPGASDVAVAPVRSDTRAALTRQVLVRTPVTPASERPGLGLPAEARVLITGADAGLGNALTQELNDRGLRAEYHSLDAFADWQGPLQGLVVIAGTETEEGFAKQAFLCVQRFGAGLRAAAEQGPALVATVSRLDGGFGLRVPASMANAASGGLSGLAKTAALEWPEITTRAIDLAPEFASVEDAAAALASELCVEGPVETGLAPGETTTLALRAEPVAASAEGFRFSSDDVLVVTGGARGVTAAVAETLAGAGRPKLALLGRTPLNDEEPEWLSGVSEERAIKKALLEHAADGLSPQELEAQYRTVASAREIRGTLDHIREAGAEVAYYAVDVRDADAVHDTLRSIEQAMGTITGVVHGAGVIADRRIEDKTPEQFDAVYETKVTGLRNVLKAVSLETLRYLMLFSSSTARFGRVGQADYAMANEALNKVAQQVAATRPGCRVVSINWGPWDGGMVTPALRDVFAKEGVGVIGLREGARFLLDALARPERDVEVVALASLDGGNVAAHDIPAEPPAVVLSFEVDIARYPFLESHVIDGKAVLPVAMYVEWMAHAALHANPGLRFRGVKNLRVLKGLILPNGAPVLVELAAGKPRVAGEVTRVHVELRSVAGDGGRVVHGDATVELATTFDEAEAALGNLSLPAYKGFPDDIYNALLFHGLSFQGITRVDGCGDEGIAILANTAPAPDRWIADPLRRRWLADPLAVDCAFQAMILWSYDRFGMASLPVRLGRYEQFQTAFPKDGVRIAAHIDKTSAHNAVATIEFLNPKDDSIVARLEGYECVMDGSLNETFRRNRLAQPTVEH